MLNAYYSKVCDSGKIFRNMKISKDPSIEKNLNTRNIFLDISRLNITIDAKIRFVKNTKIPLTYVNQ